MRGIEAPPASYPSGQHPNHARQRRSAFSASFAALTSHHVTPADIDMAERERRHRVRADDSLRLIDDLTNRSMDPMFLDSSLGRHDDSPLTLWATRIFCFVVCIAVGFMGCAFVRQLYADPRKAVRSSLASELKASQQNVETLGTQVTDLRAQIERQSKKLDANALSGTMLSDEMASGQVAVTGEGIELTVANPIAASDGTSGTGTREYTSGDRLRVVTDADLQTIVAVLWRAGAEAIAVNGERLGSQTAIRAAGGTILVGLKAVESPYLIQAIGNSNNLSHVVDRSHLGALYDEYRQAGISLQVKKSTGIRLEAAVASDVVYARKAK